CADGAAGADPARRRAPRARHVAGDLLLRAGRAARADGARDDAALAARSGQTRAGVHLGSQPTRLPRRAYRRNPHEWVSSSCRLCDPGYAGRMAAPVKVDDELDLKVDTLAYGGNGVARLNGFVVFVRRGLP